MIGSKHEIISDFIVSTVLLFYCIYCLAVLGVPIRLTTVFSVLIIISVVFFLLGLKRKTYRSEEYIKPDIVSGSYIKYFFLLPVVVLILLILARSTLQPFNYGDAEFRWNHLALKIAETGSLNFYPPVTADDFKSYFYVDGIPPLVSFSYYWLYSSFGNSEPMVTGLFVTMQFFLIFYICHKTATNLFHSKNAGFIAVAVLSSSTLFFYSVVMGQETGLTSLSIVATVYYLTGKDKSDSASMILAGFATALGALSREYGCAFVICGIIVCLWRGKKLKYTMIYLLTVLILTAPWYLRTWIRTGNPFYSISSFGGIFPINEVHCGIFKVYESYFGLLVKSYDKLYFLVSSLLFTAPIQTFLGIFSAVFLFKKYGYLTVITALISLLWAYSVGQTSGGFFHSMRVLCPAIVILSILCGGVISRWTGNHAFKNTIISLSLICIGIFTFIQNLAVPFNVWKLSLKEIIPMAFVPMEDVGKRIFYYIAPLQPHSRILSDSAFHHAALSASPEKEIMLVPVWSPEFSFLFKNENFNSSLEKLRKHGVRYILYSKNSHNNIFLEKYPFFTEYRKCSKPCLEDYYCILYELP